MSRNPKAERMCHAEWSWKGEEGLHTCLVLSSLQQRKAIRKRMSPPNLLSAFPGGPFSLRWGRVERVERTHTPVRREQTLMWRREGKARHARRTEVETTIASPSPYPSVFLNTFWRVRCVRSMYMLIPSMAAARLDLG